MAKYTCEKLAEIKEWLGPGSINFFGRQFSGKDGNARRFARQLDGMVFGGGDVLRQTKLPADLQEYMERGDLVPSGAYKQIVLPQLGQAAIGPEPLMLSAVGRKPEEIEDVVEAAIVGGHPIKAVPYLCINEDEAFRRLERTPPRGRPDDNPTALQQRLVGFNQHTLPVLEVYADMGLLLPVDATAPKDVVFDGLVNLLYERALDG